MLKQTSFQSFIWLVDLIPIAKEMISLTISLFNIQLDFVPFRGRISMLNWFHFNSSIIPSFIDDMAISCGCDVFSPFFFIHSRDTFLLISISLHSYFSLFRFNIRYASHRPIHNNGNFVLVTVVVCPWSICYGFLLSQYYNFHILCSISQLCVEWLFSYIYIFIFYIHDYSVS